MLEHSETLQLIEYAKKGDENAKSKLLEHNYPLIKSVVKRFLNKRIEYDDLYQIGCIGFLKAINKFDCSFGVKFSTYCVPMVIGEIKRFLRDDGEIKVSRGLKTLNYKITKYISAYSNENNGKQPTIEEIANEMQVDKQEIILALESGRNMIYIYEKFDDDDKSSSCFGDKLASNDSEYDEIDFLSLKSALADLDKRDKKIILLRYFRNKTQSEVAEELGVSQVQISRLEKAVIDKLRKKMM